MNDDPALIEWLQKSTAANGVPLTVEDPTVIAQAAQLVQAQQPEE
ncbi:hypothetical protein [Streptomyces antibioticus]|nr:hypothetical protein [Streptomyces antibioticus]MCX4742799.1 hypothetical protein [Streptomyces antibioticus]